MSSDAVTVRDPGAGSFEALHEPWHVKRRRQLENHVNVVLNDPYFDHPRTVTARFCR